MYKAEQEIKQLLPQNKQPVTETELGIANSLGLIYLSQERTEEAVSILRHAYLSTRVLPFLEDKTLFVRVGYNFAHALFLEQLYEQVIDIGLQILYYIQSNYLGYMQAKLHHLMSITYEELDVLNEAEDHMTKAAYIFLAESKLYFYVRTLRALAEIQFKAGKTQKGLQTLQLAEKKLPELSDPQNLHDSIEHMKIMYLSNIPT